MAQGLEVFNPDGTIRDSVTTRFARIIKRVAIPKAVVPASQEGVVWLSSPLVSGTIEVPEFADWSPFFFFSGNEYSPAFTPDVTITGTSLYWEIYPNAEMGTFTESRLLGAGTSNGYPAYFVGGFWLNIGVY